MTVQSKAMAKMLIDNVPDDARNHFKARCALNETTMRDELIRFMTARGGRDTAVIAGLIADLAQQEIDGDTKTREKLDQIARLADEITGANDD